MRDFTNQEKRKLLNGELSRRKRLYPHLVHMGHMTKDDADVRLAILTAIVADYRSMPAVIDGGRS